jgi:hypothetical protein
VKLIKRLGLTAVAAIAAMAIIGTSGASAEVLNIALCKEDVLTCPSNKIITHIHAVATGVKLLTNLLTVTCEGLFLGDVLNGSPTIGLAHLTLIISGHFTYVAGTCSSSLGGSCEAKEISTLAEIEAMKTADEKTEITGKGEVLVKCGSSLHCVYNGTGLKGEGLGALLASPNGEEKTEEAVTNKVSGTLCPSTSKLDALYKPLEPTYVKS